MFESIKGKRVLITGATGGMGSAMAELFAEYGATVGLHYHKNKEEAERLLASILKKTKNAYSALQSNSGPAGSGQAEIFQADLSEEKDRKELLISFEKKFGGIDVLINNAGAVYEYAHFSELKEESWEGTFDLNAKAPFYLSGGAFDSMKQSGGRIINISSANVEYGGSPKSMHYVASKAALESITRGFAKIGAKDNILVNAIRCGVIDTPMRNRIPGYNEKDYQNRIAMIPLKRAGAPLDIARMALFLASEAGDFITGEIFTVAGGD